MRVIFNILRLWPSLTPTLFRKRESGPNSATCETRRYSAATSFWGGVKTMGARAAAFSDAARRSAVTGP